MCLIADWTEFPGGSGPQSLPLQAGRHRLNVVPEPMFAELISNARCTVALLCLMKSLADHPVTLLAKLLTWARLYTTGTPGIPAAAGHAQYPAHGFDTELCPMFFDEDMLHFRRFAKYVAAFWRIAAPPLPGLLRQLALQAGIFGSQLILPFGGRSLLLNFAAPRIKLRLIKGKFACSGGNADSLSKLQGFAAVFRRILFSWLLGYGC